MEQSEERVGTPVGDLWLERRLRVFERALAALETRAEADRRAHIAAIGRLEERLAQISAPSAPVVQAVPAPLPAQPQPEPEAVLPLPPPVSRAEMAAVLDTARRKIVMPAPPPKRRSKARRRLPWAMVGLVALVTALSAISLTVGGTAQASGQGVAYRRAAPDSATRLQALADSGDAHAQAQLAMRYLQDGDTARALRWSAAAAQAGQPVAQYVLGTLTDDKAMAVALFRAAAMQGNLKAMHNLAIAYAEGRGVDPDAAAAADWFARAAAHGYVDSAFDLAVLYERGLGVTQDLAQALKWYDVAALAGDAPAAARAEFLRQQMPLEKAQAALAAARAFMPLQPAGFANRL